MPFPHGLLVSGLLAWYDYDRNPEWLQITQKLIKGLHRVAEQNEQRAWFRNSHSPNLELAGFAESCQQPKLEDVRFQVFMEAAPLKGGGSWSVDRITLEYPGTRRVALDDFNADDIDESKWVTILNADVASIHPFVRSLADCFSVFVPKCSALSCRISAFVSSSSAYSFVFRTTASACLLFQ